jgi:hypothetical protein
MQVPAAPSPASALVPSGEFRTPVQDAHRIAADLLRLRIEPTA